MTMKRHLIAAVSAGVIAGSALFAGVAVAKEPADLGGFSPLIHRAAPDWNYGAGVHFSTGYFSGIIKDSRTGIDYLCAADGAHMALVAGPITSGSMNPADQVSVLPVSTYVPKGTQGVSHEISDPNVLAQISYVASTIGAPDATEAAAREAALARIGEVYTDSVWDQAATGRYTKANTAALIPAAHRASEIQGEAQRLAGPYSSRLEIVMDEGGQSGTLRGIGAVSAQGNWLAGRPYSIELSGPVSARDQSQLVGTTAASPIDGVGFTVTGTGVVSAKISVKQVPPDRPWIATGSSNKGQAQNLIEINRTVEWESPPIDKPVIKAFQPVVRTRVTEEVLRPGSALVDEVTLTSSDPWLNIEGTQTPIPVAVRVDVYGPFDEPLEEFAEPPNPDELPALGSYSLVFDGPGTKLTDSHLSAKAEGFYFFRAVVDRDEQGEYKDFIQEFESPYFEVAETSRVPWRAKITTSATAVMIDEDRAGVRDEITVEGFPEDHGVFEGTQGWESDAKSIVHSLYFIPDGTEHVEGVTQDLEPLAQVQTPAKNGEFVIEAEEFPIDWDLGNGTYQVVSEFAGDSRVEPVRTSDTDPSEQVRPPFGSVATTAFSEAGDAKSGVQIADNIMLSGNFPAQSYTEVDLFSWPVGEQPVCENPIWTSKEIVHDGEPGTYVTDFYQTNPESELTYGFVERTHDQAGNIIAQGKCGATPETISTKPSNPVELPQTGANTIGLALGAIFALSTGAVLVVRSRRK